MTCAADQFGGNSPPNFPGPNIDPFGNNRSGGDNGAIANCYSGQDSCTGTDGHIVSHLYWVVRQFFPLDDMWNEQGVLAHNAVAADFDELRIKNDA